MNNLTQRSYWIIGLVIAVITTYWSSYHIPLIFDDLATVSDNTTIRHLNKLGTIFAYPEGIVLAWRPFANFTYALSFAISGTAPWSYHIFDMLLHTSTSIVLFYIIKKTLRFKINSVNENDATLIAGATTLIWAVHPILTNTVVYISQRTESLMALFYLLTLLFFINAITLKKIHWYVLAFLTCFLGTLSKEVIVTAPVIALLYDRTFISGSFKQALNKNKYIYLILISTWVSIGILIKSLKTQAVGYTTNVNWFEYALTETKAIFTYLKLSVFPYPLIFDRGPVFLHSINEAFIYILITGILVSYTIWALIKKPTLGFLCSWFLIILSPTSSIIPIAEEPIAENRLYLPSIAVICLIVFYLYKIIGSKKTTYVCLLLAIIYSTISIHRISDYITGFSIWNDTVIKAPDNPRAHNNLGLMWEREKHQPNKALLEYNEALRLDPLSIEPRNNRSVLISQLPGHINEAINEYELILKKYPNYAEVHNNIALLLAHEPSRQTEALAHYERAIKLKPLRPDLYTNYAGLLRQIPGREKDAIIACQKAIDLEPNNVTSLNNMAVLLANNGHIADAEKYYRKALSIKPDAGDTYFNLGNLLMNIPSQKNEAIENYIQSIKYNPSNAEAEYNLANLYASIPTQKNEAILHFEKAIKINPNHSGAHNNLAILLATIPERTNEAIFHYRETIRLIPDSFGPHYNLGTELMKISDNNQEAIKELKIALKLNPDFKAAQDALNQIYNRKEKH